MRPKKKPTGQPVDCPCCGGTGFQRVYTFAQLEEVMSNHGDGQLRGHIQHNGKWFKVFLHIEEVVE